MRTSKEREANMIYKVYLVFDDTRTKWGYKRYLMGEHINRDRALSLRDDVARANPTGKAYIQKEHN